MTATNFPETADVTGLVLEFFSGSQGKWIAAEIIDRDDNGAVQVDAQPGRWLSAKDCKRKLRARAYLDNEEIGSTILPPDAFLLKPDAVSLTKAKKDTADSKRGRAGSAASQQSLEAIRQLSAASAGSPALSRQVSPVQAAEHAAELQDKDRPKLSRAPKALSPQPGAARNSQGQPPSAARHSSSTLTSGSTSMGMKGAAHSVSAKKLGSIPGWSALGGEPTRQNSDTPVFVGEERIRKKEAPRLAEVINADEIADSRHSCGTPTSGTTLDGLYPTQEPSPKGRVVPDPPCFQPATRATAGPPTTYGPPAARSNFSCPRCGAADLPSFEIAVQHCAGPDQADKAGSGSVTPRSSPTITDLPNLPKRLEKAGPLVTDLPPGFQAGRQRNGLRFVVGTVPVPIQKEDELESNEKYAVLGVAKALVEGLLQSSSPPVEVNVDAGAETDSTRSSEGRGPMPGALPEQSAAPRPRPGSLREALPGELNVPSAEVGEAIAYDIGGNPIITRKVNVETGQGVTTVINGDGTISKFGKSTLASLMSSDETETQAWIDSLTCLSTRGLVHEIGQVLLSTSKVYQFHLDRLKALSEKCHYSFFGLTEDASDQELDRAYKKLARSMHPDKNGGTDEAKEAFQAMKDKYEALKEQRENAMEDDDPRRRKSSKDNGDDPDELCDNDERGQSKEDRRKEAYDEDEDEVPKKQESGKMSYDPTDQDSLAATALEMLQRLKAIEGSMTTVLSQLREQGI